MLYLLVVGVCGAAAAATLAEEESACLLQTVIEASAGGGAENGRLAEGGAWRLKPQVASFAMEAGQGVSLLDRAGLTRRYMQGDKRVVRERRPPPMSEEPSADLHPQVKDATVTLDAQNEGPLLDMEGLLLRYTQQGAPTSENSPTEAVAPVAVQGKSTTDEGRARVNTVKLDLGTSTDPKDTLLDHARLQARYTQAGTGTEVHPRRRRRDSQDVVNNGQILEIQRLKYAVVFIGLGFFIFAVVRYVSIVGAREAARRAAEMPDEIANGAWLIASGSDASPPSPGKGGKLAAATSDEDLMGAPARIERVVSGFWLEAYLAHLRGAYGLPHLNGRTADGDTVLHLAAFEGRGDLVMSLLQEQNLRVHPESLGAGGRTALHAAALGGSVEAVEALLDSSRFLAVKTLDTSGDTALEVAERRGDRAVASLIRRSQYGGGVSPVCAAAAATT